MKKLSYLVIVGAVVLTSYVNAENFNIASILGIKFSISFEERADEGVVFRPNGYNFPPSYPRVGFKFDADGQYTFFEPRHDDAGVIAVSGRWLQLRQDVFELYKNGVLDSIVRLSGGLERIQRVQSR